MKHFLKIIFIVLLAIGYIAIMQSCKKITPPVVTTFSVSGVTPTSAVSGGNVKDDGGAEVTARGICWGTLQNPTTALSRTSDGSGTGSFISYMTDLAENTTYYVRAYATNIEGTAFGDQMSFETLPMPVYLSSAIEDTTPSLLEIYFSLELADIIPSSSAFNIGVNSGKRTVVSVTISGTKVRLKLSSQVCYGDVVTVAYAQPSSNPLQTMEGTKVGSFSPRNVDNHAGPFDREPSFNPNLTYGLVSDVEGNLYKTIQIGTQTWMAENLKTTSYRNGEQIGTTATFNTSIHGEIEPKYQWSNNDNTLVGPYGRYYTWYAATDSRNVCPTGWHIPLNSEWSLLINYLGGDSIAGDRLKPKCDNYYWRCVMFSEANTATNESGFTALGAGYRLDHGDFGEVRGIGESTNYWSSAENNWAWTTGIGWVFGFVTTGYNNKFVGNSIRCIKD